MLDSPFSRDFAPCAVSSHNFNPQYFNLRVSSRNKQRNILQALRSFARIRRASPKTTINSKCHTSNKPTKTITPIIDNVIDNVIKHIRTTNRHTTRTAQLNKATHITQKLQQIRRMSPPCGAPAATSSCARTQLFHPGPCFPRFCKASPA